MREKKNAEPTAPSTHRTLLEAIQDANSPRWAEFQARYRPLMTNYAKKKFPTLDIEEIFNDALLALFKRLPNYRYAPEETGAFHNYLIGIVNHIGLHAAAKRKRRATLFEKLQKTVSAFSAPRGESESESALKEAIVKISEKEFFADPRVSDRNKEVFRRLLNGDKPEAIAKDFGIERNNVDQIKNRAGKRIIATGKALWADYERAGHL